MKEQPELPFNEDAPSWFKEYHKKHPQVYRGFVNYSMRAIDRGFKTYSAKAVFEILRFETGINASYPDGFKIDNRATPFYARMFMKEFPQYSEFFRTRKSKADEE